ACELLTIGHFNLAADRFVALLKDAGVTAVADVRSVPFSRWCPWFSGKALAQRLAGEAVAYRARGRAGRPPARSSPLSRRRRRLRGHGRQGGVRGRAPTRGG